ncbi:MAG: NAD(P)/FAD-dependent oxidoreductase [Spirochaetales bacterium]|nr:NAD(P)/FAD-dependent oxidoreductase [Spirochaetales bacterium]
MKESFDLIVIGAGPGGSTLAALMAKKGRKVLVVDKNPRAGGRMLTVRKHGFSYEMFPINGVPARNSLFEEVSRRLDLEEELQPVLPKKVGVLYYEDSAGKLNRWVMGSSPWGLMTALGVRLWKPLSLIRTFRALKEMATLPPAEIEKLYDISAMQYFKRFEPLPEGIRTYILASFGEGAFEMPSDHTSAAEMLKLFQAAQKNGGGRYYRGGIGTVFEAYTRRVEELGGKVLMNTRVDHINFRKGAACGVTTEDGQKFDAPIVVSNAGLRQTVLKLAGKKHFSEEYLSWCRNLEHNLACAGFRYFLDAPVLEYPMYIYYPEGCVAPYKEFEDMASGLIKPAHSYIYLGTTSLYPDTAPPGKQLVYACMSCIADPELDISPYLEYVEKRVRKIMPELFDHISHTETFGPGNVAGIGTDIVLPGQGGESYGLALSTGQSGPAQPGHLSPVAGLYFVGCDAGGSGLGTHQALDSAVKLAALLE